MSEFLVALTTDADIFTWEPQLTNSSAIVGNVDHLHTAASDEVARDLRVRWWAEVVSGAKYYPDTAGNDLVTNGSMLTIDGLDTAKLSRAQLSRLAIYRLLAWHIWPMLNPMNDAETMAGQKAKSWRAKYADELESILTNGVAYDWSGTGTASLQSTTTVPRTKSVRLERE